MDVTSSTTSLLFQTQRSSSFSFSVLNTATALAPAAPAAAPATDDDTAQINSSAPAAASSDALQNPQGLASSLVAFGNFSQALSAQFFASTATQAAGLLQGDSAPAASTAGAATAPASPETGLAQFVNKLTHLANALDKLVHSSDNGHGRHSARRIHRLLNELGQALQGLGNAAAATTPDAAAATDATDASATPAATTSTPATTTTPAATTPATITTPATTSTGTTPAATTSPATTAQTAQQALSSGFTFDIEIHQSISIDAALASVQQDGVQAGAIHFEAEQVTRLHISFGQTSGNATPVNLNDTPATTDAPAADDASGTTNPDGTTPATGTTDPAATDTTGTGAADGADSTGDETPAVHSHHHHHHQHHRHHHRGGHVSGGNALGGLFAALGSAAIHAVLQGFQQAGSSSAPASQSSDAAAA